MDNLQSTNMENGRDNKTDKLRYVLNRRVDFVRSVFAVPGTELSMDVFRTVLAELKLGRGREINEAQRKLVDAHKAQVKRILRENIRLLTRTQRMIFLEVSRVLEGTDKDST